MPELPEVQTIVNAVRPALISRRIAAVHLLRVDMLQPASTNLPALLQGQRVADVDRRGKRIVFTLENGDRFYIHLGMTGRLTLGDESEPLPPHTHLTLDFEIPDAREGSPPLLSRLRFVDPRRFGGIWWLGAQSADDGMGPEPLTLDARQLAARLSRTHRAIKNALLDQSVVAGLGNIYVDESLFAAGIHPLWPADRLSREQVATLTRSIKTVLRRALKHRGSTLRDYRDANGNAGKFQNLHRVYARRGKPCWNCKAPLERLVIGGRSTHFCPTCQKPGRP